MQYVILTSTGYRTGEGIVSRWFADAKVFNHKTGLVIYIRQFDCEDNELVLCANTQKLLGNVGNLK